MKPEYVDGYELTHEVAEEGSMGCDKCEGAFSREIVNQCPWCGQDICDWCWPSHKVACRVESESVVSEVGREEK